MNNQPPTPEQKIKQAKFILWLGIVLIIIIGLAVAVYFVFMKTAGQGNVNVAKNVNSIVSNTNTVSNTNKSANVSTNVNTEVNTNTAVANNTEIITTSWQNYYIDWTNKLFYKILADGTKENISLTFNFDDYNNDLTPYGAIFWRRGPNKTITLKDIGGPYTYEGAINPDFQFYDFTKKEFIIMPKKELQRGEQKFERVYTVHFSSSELKLLIEIGQYDTQSSEFEPGMYEEQPVKTYGLIYNIETNSYESGDPISIYLKVLDSASTLGDGLYWDSKNQIGVATPGGEGCGNYNSITFVDLKNKTKEVAGGLGSFTFKKDLTCNPSNGVSPDGKWFILLGESNNDKLDLYLFKSETRMNPVKQKIGLSYPITNNYSSLPRSVEKWDLSKDYPIITLNDNRIVDFN